MTRDELTKENQTYHRQISAQTIYRANNFEYEMLAKHVDVLMENVDAICNSAQWKQIHLPYVGIFAMYVNLESIRLGQLLHAWNNNSMKLDEYHVVKVVGSPLSGSHSAYGFHKNDHTTWKNIGRIFERFGDGITLFSKKDKGVSYWSLGQLLVELGINIPPTILYQKRTAVGQYDYASKRLTLLNETYDLTNCFANPNDDVESLSSIQLKKRHFIQTKPTNSPRDTLSLGSRSATNCCRACNKTLVDSRLRMNFDRFHLWCDQSIQSKQLY